MKRFVFTCSCLLIALLFSLQSNAQNRTNGTLSTANNPSSKQKQNLLRSADRGQKMVIGLLLPTVQAARKSAGPNRPSLQKMRDAYLKKCAQVKNTKGRITPAQYNQFQANFTRLEKDLDHHIRMYFAEPGVRKGSQFSDCYTDCHTSFPGIGGGAGANRFACKFGCFVEATGGRRNN